MTDLTPTHDKPDIVPYQSVLRSIGAELDARAASRVSIIEAPSGFTVRFSGGTTEESLLAITFENDELVRISKELEGGRAVLRFGKSPDANQKYQDFLRALGHELEEAGAYSVLIDELETSVVVTYQYFDLSSGYLPHKQMTVIDPDQRVDMLKRARGRRARGRRLGLRGQG